MDLYGCYPHHQMIISLSKFLSYIYIYIFIILICVYIYVCLTGTQLEVVSLVHVVNRDLADGCRRSIGSSPASTAEARQGVTIT